MKRQRVSDRKTPEIRMVGRGLLCRKRWLKLLALLEVGQRAGHNSLSPVSNGRNSLFSGAMDDWVEVKVYEAEE